MSGFFCFYTMKTFYAIKKDQSHTYDKNGKRIFLTKLEANPLVITQLKNELKDKYKAFQVAFGNKRKVTKPLLGHVKAAKVTPKYLKEIRLEEDSDKKVGDKITLSEVFSVGDLVELRSKMKGRGFTGVMKRWGFGGGPRTHGQSDRQRSPGSIGQGTDPGRVWKGKKMPGRYGSKFITQRGSQVIYLSDESNEIWVSGGVAGHKGTLVKISKVGQKNFIGLLNEGKKEIK